MKASAPTASIKVEVRVDQVNVIVNDIDRIDQVGIDLQVVEIGVHPVDLALEAEHAEVISAIYADIVSHLGVEAEDVVELLSVGPSRQLIGVPGRC